MIIKRDDLQCLECSICGEAVELTRKVMSDPEAVFLLKEHLTKDHESCAPYAGDRAAAVRNRAFHVRMQAELRGLEDARTQVPERLCRKPATRAKDLHGVGGSASVASRRA